MTIQTVFAHHRYSHACLAGYPRVFNGGVGDISKRRVSRQVVEPSKKYSGPGIVKTNASCGGRSKHYGRSVPVGSPFPFIFGGDL